MPPSLPRAKGEPETDKEQISKTCALHVLVDPDFDPNLGSTRPAWALAIALLHNWPLEGTVDPLSEPLSAASGTGRERGRERRRGRG